MSPAVKCLILLAVVALLFVTELIPLAIAMGGAIACGLLGFIPNKHFLVSNSTVVLLAGMFVVGAAHVLHRSCTKSVIPAFISAVPVKTA